MLLMVLEEATAFRSYLRLVYGFPVEAWVSAVLAWEVVGYVVWPIPLRYWLQILLFWFLQFVVLNLPASLVLTFSYLHFWTPSAVA